MKRESGKGDCFLDYLSLMQAWRLVLTKSNCITAFSFLSVGFPPFNLGERVGQTSQLTNQICLERHNSGCLTWFEHNTTKEEYGSAR